MYRNGSLVASPTTTDDAGFGTGPTTIMIPDNNLSPSTQYCYTVSALDAAGNESAQSSTRCATTSAASITPTLTITTTSFNPATATVGTGYAAQEAVSATGGQAPYGCSASGLPNGMAINSSTCAVYGTPIVSGTFNVTVTVTDSSSPQKSASKVLSLTVLNGDSLPAGYVSQGGLTWMPETFQLLTWPDANAYCNSTAINGQNGWRLPTKDELVSLYNSGAMNGQGWTLSFTWSLTLVNNLSNHYEVSLNDGFVYDLAVDSVNTYHVTCVR